MSKEGKSRVVFRTPEEENDGLFITRGIIADDEWDDGEGSERVFLDSWDKRYQYEAEVLRDIIEGEDIKSIAEIGSGPGGLHNKLKDLIKYDEYHLVDIEEAKLQNEKNGFGGTFHIRDLNDGVKLNLDHKLDLFIANDVLEHLQNPSKIIVDFRNQLKEGGHVFISVPNWRMGHNWVYRGLFDWDNFIHFMWVHGFSLVGYEKSPLKTKPYKILQSESTMPVELNDSWNQYILFKKNKTG